MASRGGARMCGKIEDVLIREALRVLIHSVGLQVEVFGSGKEFLDRKLPETPACLTLDIRLPGISGLELQRHLAEADIRIPIVFITGQGDIATSVRAMKAGAVDFLTKPFHAQELLDSIVRAVEQDRVRLQQEAETSILQDHFDR